MAHVRLDWDLGRLSTESPWLVKEGISQRGSQDARVNTEWAAEIYVSVGRSYSHSSLQSMTRLQSGLYKSVQRIKKNKPYEIFGHKIKVLWSKTEMYCSLHLSSSLIFQWMVLLRQIYVCIMCYPSLIRGLLVVWKDQDTLSKQTRLTLPQNSVPDLFTQLIILMLTV